MSNAIKASLLRAKALYVGFVAGAPEVDDSTLEVAADTLRVKAGGITTSHLASSAGVLRSQLATDVAAKAYGVPLTSMKNTDGSTIAAGSAGVSGGFSVNVASHVETLVGQTADSATKTSVARFRYALPDNYVAGGTITFTIATKLISVTGTGVTNNGSDCDLSAYKQAHGAVGSDLVTTNAATYAALDTWYDKAFTVDPTGLVAGDVLSFEITLRAIESNAGNGTLQSAIGEVSIAVDVKG